MGGDEDWSTFMRLFDVADEADEEEGSVIWQKGKAKNGRRVYKTNKKERRTMRGRDSRI